MTIRGSIKKVLTVSLTAAVLITSLPQNNIQAASHTSNTLSGSKKYDLTEGTYKEHEVLVRFDKRCVKAKKGSAKRLQSVRKDAHVAYTFGTVMESVKGDSDIAATVEAQKDILADSLNKDYVIEDSIDFDDFVISRVSSRADDTKTMIDKLNGEDGIKEVMPNYVIKAQSTDFSLNDEYIEHSYSLADESTKNEYNNRNMALKGSMYERHTKDATMNVTNLWKANESKHISEEDDIVVAVIDSGVDYTHEDLKEHMWENPGDIGLCGKYGYDFHNNDDDPMDDFDHGTHCAGIIAAQADNGVGISGVAGKFADDGHVKLMAVKVLNSSGSGFMFNIYAGYRYILTAAENGVPVRVINQSLGGGGIAEYCQGFDEIFEELGELGVLICAAAGNEYYDMDHYDYEVISSHIDNVVVVGSNNEMGDIAGYSNYGKSQVDLFAPGSNVLSTIAHSKFLPVVYSEEQLKATTQTYGVFEEGSVTPVSPVEGIDSFGEPLILDKDGKEIKEGVTLSVTDERYKNTSTKKSLKVEIASAKKEEEYCIYFPYKTEKKADGSNVTISSSVGIKYNQATDGVQGWYGMKSMLRYDDGSIRVTGKIGTDYTTYRGDYSLNDMSIEKTFPYTEAALADSQGIAVFYIASKDGPATLYIDGLAVSKAGLNEALFGKYAFFSGTSMACPNAVGALALLSIFYPDKIKDEEGHIQVKKLKDLLYSTVTRSDKFKDKCITGGRIDLSKLASGKLEPVISAVKVSAEDKTVTIEGVNFGTVKGTVEAEYVLNGNTYSVPAEDILSWDDGKIVLKDSIEADGSYKLRGHYLYMTVNTDNGGMIRSAYYLNDGLSMITRLEGQYEAYAINSMTSDGHNVYVTGKNEYLFKIDPETGKREQINNLGLESILLEGSDGLEKYGYGLYEGDNSLYVDKKSNLVYVDGKLYKWMHITASDRYYYVGLVIDPSVSKPEWEIMSIETVPKKSGYENFPRNMMYYGVAFGAYNGKIYAIGGDDTSTEEVGTKLVSVFDPKTRKWSVLEDELPAPAYYLRLAESNGKLYALLGSRSDDGSDIRQPDRNIYCYDGENFTICDISLPEFDKPGVADDGEIFTGCTLAAAGDGIVICGTSVEGYGDTFMLDTSGTTLKFRPLDYALYRTLNTNDYKIGVGISYTDSNGNVREGVLIYKEENGFVNRNHMFWFDVPKTGTKTTGTTTSSVQPEKQPSIQNRTEDVQPSAENKQGTKSSEQNVKENSSVTENRPETKSSVKNEQEKNSSAENSQETKSSEQNERENLSSAENRSETKTAVQNEQEKTSSAENSQGTKASTQNEQENQSSVENRPETKTAVQNGQENQSSSGNTLETKTTVQNNQEAGSPAENKATSSKASLKCNRKTVKRDKSYTIRILGKNGQKTGFSVWNAKNKKKALNKGVTVNSAGKIKVSKNAVKGTYIIRVNVNKNKQYKAKELIFTLKVA